MAAVVTPNLTTIRQPIEEMAADAVRLLVDHLSAFDMAATDSLLDYRLIVRASTAPPPLGGVSAVRTGLERPTGAPVRALSNARAWPRRG